MIELNQETADAIKTEFYNTLFWAAEMKKFPRRNAYEMLSKILELITVSESVGEVHSWSRMLSIAEINERFRLHQQGKIENCDCDFCRLTAVDENKNSLKECVFGMILAERLRQDEKWGNQCHKPNPVWLAILTEEVGETAKAILEGLPTLTQEVIEVAAVSFAWLECLLQINKKGE